MRKGFLIFGGLIVLLLILFMWWQSTYNSLVQMDQGVKQQIGQVNTAYQQRADLIPNLVATVQGAAGAERGTLTDVINARSRASSIQLTPEALKDPQAFQNFQKAQGDLTSALSHLMVLTENYPQLQSQGNFPVLMSQLEGQENRIRVERNRYNDVVKDYNSRVLSFPTSIIAGSKFTSYPYFEAGVGAENAPRVSFGDQPQGPPVEGQSRTGGSTTNPGSGTAPAPGSTPSPNATPHGALRPAPVH